VTLRSINNVTRPTIHTFDELLGSVTNIHLADRQWTVRYFVVDFRNLLSSQKLSISPMSIDTENWGENNKLWRLMLSPNFPLARNDNG